MTRCLLPAPEPSNLHGSHKSTPPGTAFDENSKLISICEANCHGDETDAETETEAAPAHVAIHYAVDSDNAASFGTKLIAFFWITCPAIFSERSATAVAARYRLSKQALNNQIRQIERRIEAAKPLPAEMRSDANPTTKQDTSPNAGGVHEGDA